MRAAVHSSFPRKLDPDPLTVLYQLGVRATTNVDRGNGGDGGMDLTASYRFTEALRFGSGSLEMRSEDSVYCRHAAA